MNALPPIDVDVQYENLKEKKKQRTFSWTPFCSVDTSLIIAE